MSAYSVTATKDRTTLRQTFPYLSEAFMFMRRMHEDGWTVEDPKPVGPDAFAGFRLKTKEEARV